MSGNTKNFSASIDFGATLDASVGRTLNRLTSGIEDVGSVSLKTMGVQTKWMQELQSGSASSASKIKNMEQATASLLKKQAELEKEIREGIKTGRAGTAFLIEDYQRVGVAIARATKELDEMNREQEKLQKEEEKRQRRKERMANFGSATVGFAKGAPGALISATGWAGAGAAAALAAPIMLNQGTAEKLGQAKSYGLGINEYQTMGLLAKQAGLNAENAGDLAEELTNKLYEQGNEKMLDPILQQMGFENRKQLTSLGTQGAFKAVMQVLSTMKDKGSAASLADQLMGGEGNKILSYIHSTDKPFLSLLTELEKYNLLTQEGAEGAAKANSAVNNLWGVALSGMEDTIGKISGQLAPTIDFAAAELAGWIKGIQPQILSAVTEWMKPDQAGRNGPQRLWDGMVKFAEGVELVADVVMAVASKLKWLAPDNTKPEDMETVEKARIRGVELAADEASSKKLGFWESRKLGQQRADEAEQAWIEKRTRTHVPDYVGFDDDVFGGPVPGQSLSKSQTDNRQYNFNVTLAPGTPEEQANSLYSQFKSLTGNTPEFSPTIDMPG